MAATCTSSLPAAQLSSLSRKAINLPCESSIAAFLAAAAPRLLSNFISFTRASARTYSLITSQVPSREPSSTTMSSSRPIVCASTDSIDLPINAAELKLGMTTETRSSDIIVARFLGEIANCARARYRNRPARPLPPAPVRTGCARRRSPAPSVPRGSPRNPGCGTASTR